MHTRPYDMFESPLHMIITVLPPSVRSNDSGPFCSAGQYTSSKHPSGSSHAPSAPQVRVMFAAGSCTHGSDTVSPSAVSGNT